MNRYRVYSHKLDSNRTVINEVVVTGLQEVWKYCGGRLHKVGYGYCGINTARGIEYVAVRER